MIKNIYYQSKQKKLSRNIGIILLVSSAVDVIDLGGGLLGFTLLPFHILAILYLIYKLPEIGKYKLEVRHFCLTHLSLIIFSLLVLFSSLLLNEDPYELSSRRTLILVFLIIFSMIFVYLNQGEFLWILLTSTKIYIILNGIAFLLQYILLLEINPFTDIIGTYVPDLMPIPDEEGILRLHGLVRDSSRSAVKIIFLLTLAYIAGKKSLPYDDCERLEIWIYIIGFTEVALTLSRNALAIIPIFLLIVFLYSNFKTRLFLVKSTLLSIILVIPVIFFVVTNQEIMNQIQLAFISSAGREYSTLVHFKLIEDATNIIFFSDIKTFFIGRGWGTEYVYTSEYFPDSAEKYGNFHSGFLSAGVQSGIFALLLNLFYTIKPLLFRYKWGLFVVILVWVNLFYQYHIEPFYWILLVAINTKKIQNQKNYV
ncbi:MAG: hypothetical protein AN488_03410 [Anabaena sp. WA113]|jgi:hypothetical protein|nr:MAG: hypothetical protein AN488_03410 [Anabaena sp. WA113]